MMSDEVERAMMMKLIITDLPANPTSVATGLSSDGAFHLLMDIVRVCLEHSTR